MKRALTLLLLAAVLLVSAFINETSNQKITGYAVKSQNDLQVEIEVLAADDSLKLLSEGSQLCAVVELDNSTTYYYRLIKTTSGVDVKYEYCADPGQNNLIIKFNSYDDLANFRANPLTFLTGSINKGYYIFPSAYVAKGGSLNCNPDFQSRYCGVAYFYMTKDQMRSSDMACCADFTLSKAMQNKIDELKQGTRPASQQPLQFLFSPIGFAILGIFIIVVISTSAIVVLRKPHKPEIAPELGHYISTSIEQGYPHEQIKEALVQAGWDTKTVEAAIQHISSRS